MSDWQPNIAPDLYGELRRVLRLAYDQAASGKGAERHGDGRPFERQRIMNLARDVGPGGLAFQVCKKTQEATGAILKGQHERARCDLLGAIVYLAAEYLLSEEMERESRNE